MANRIKGITVEINGDTTKLSKALKGMNKIIKSNQTQLKDVEKLLKLDPTNTELLSQNRQIQPLQMVKLRRNSTMLYSVCRMKLKSPKRH